MEKSVPEFVQWSLERTSHPFHMWDGITSIPDTLTTVLTPEVQKSVQQAAASLTNARSIHFLGCGSSYFSGIAGTYTFNVVAGITAYAHDAWEFATYPPIGIGHSALVAISHTGGTPAVLDSVRIATKNGVPTIGLTDVSGSDLERMTSQTVLGGGGRELALPKTRSYVASLLKHYLLAVEVGRQNSSRDLPKLRTVLEESPHTARKVLKNSEALAKLIGANLSQHSQVFIFGAGPNVATAYEGALKLQETVQLPAHGWELEEGMHGPWVTINPGDLVIVLALKGPSLEKAKALITALRTIEAQVWVITDEENPIPNATYETRIVTDVPEYFSPLYTVLPLYQFTYFLALRRGIRPDAMRLTDERYLHTRLSLPR